MKTNFTSFLLKTNLRFLFSFLFFVLIGLAANAQLGVYSFTGVGACPNQNPSVTGQPANAVFSNYNNSGVTLLVLLPQMLMNTGTGIPVAVLISPNTMNSALLPMRVII